MKRYELFVVVFILFYILSQVGFAQTEVIECTIKNPARNIIAQDKTEFSAAETEGGQVVTKKCSIEFVPAPAFCSMSGQYKYEVYNDYSNGTTTKGSAYYATCAKNQTFGTSTTKDEFYCDTNYKQGSCGTNSGLKCYQCNCFGYDENPQFCSDGTAVGDCSCSNLGMRCEVNQTKEKYTDINKALILVDRCHECGDQCPYGKKCLFGPNNITFLENFQLPKTLTIQNYDGDVSYGQASNSQYHISPYSYWITKTNDEGYARVIITDSAKTGGSGYGGISGATTQNFGWNIESYWRNTSTKTLYKRECCKVGKEAILYSSLYYYNRNVNDSQGYNCIETYFTECSENQNPACNQEVTVTRTKYIVSDRQNITKENRTFQTNDNFYKATSYYIKEGQIVKTDIKFQIYECPTENVFKESATGGGVATSSEQDYGAIPSSVIGPSGTTYTLTSNNPNVQVYFSDTKTQTTTNPNAHILGVINTNPHTIETTSSGTHSATAWVYSTQPEAARIVVLKDGAIVASSQYNKATKVWEKLSTTFTPSSGSYTIAIEVAKQADVYIDDVSFAQWAYGCMGVCIDNTPWGECSATQIGKICGENSQLEPACDTCGCPSGQYCLKTTCVVPDNLTFTGTVTPNSVVIGNPVTMNINVRNPFFIDKYAKVTCELNGPLGLKTLSSECKVVKNSSAKSTFSLVYLIDNNTAAKGVWNVSCWIDDSMNADCSNPRISDSQYIGNVTVSLLGCSDGTPDGVCSPFNKGKKCVNGVLVDSCEECFAKTGCPQNQGCDPTTHGCNNCSSIVAPDTYPPVLTRGEEKCTQTGGILKQINKTINGFDTGCVVDYTCDCGSRSYSDTNGCFESCDNDGTCEQWERASCRDCSVYFASGPSYTETDSGLRFTATMTQNLLNPVFRVCRDVPITQCENAYTLTSNSCGQTGPCLCGYASGAGNSFSCNVNCYDTSGKYYVLVNGTLGTNSVKIASDYFDYACPYLNVSKLSQYLETFRSIHETTSILVMQSYNNLIGNVGPDDVCINKNILTSEDCWRYHMTINQDVKAIAAFMVNYLKPIVNGINTTKSSTQEAFRRVDEAIQRIFDIYGASYVIFRLDSINYADRGMINQTFSITANVSRNRDETRYGIVTCEIKPPTTAAFNISSSCSDLRNEFELNFIPNRVGNWIIKKCWLNGSVYSDCAESGIYDIKDVNGNISVVNETKVSIKSANILTATILNNTEAIINVNVTPSVYYDRYVFSYCTLVDPANNTKVITSDCKYLPSSGGSVNFLLSSKLDVAGNWTVTNCSIDASFASDCSNSLIEDKKDNIGRIAVVTLPPNMTISSINVLGASFDEQSVVNVVVTNPAVSRYALVGCNVIKPDLTTVEITTPCTLVQGGTNYTFKPNITIDQVGDWNFNSCYLKVSNLSTCENSVIHDTKLNVGGFTVSNLSIVPPIVAPGILDINERAEVNVTIRNRGSAQNKIFVNCIFVDPDGREYTIKSDDAIINPYSTITIKLGMVVSKAGNWTIERCDLYRY